MPKKTRSSEEKSSTTSSEDQDWAQFLAAEGLEVLAAYRSIRNAAVRAMFVRLMKEAAQEERNGAPDLN